MFETIMLISIVTGAAFVQGLTGFGFGLIALPLLGLFIPIKTIIPLVLMLALFISLTLTVQLRHSIQTKTIFALTLATIPGIPVGIYILKNIPAGPLALMVGIVMVLFTSHQLIASPKTIKLSTPTTLCTGFLSGILTASISTGGPPAIIYTALQPWSKDQAKGTLACYFFIGGLATIISHAWAGLITSEVISYFTITLPALASGIIAGTIAYKHISDRSYKSIALLSVFLLGCVMIYKNI